MKSLEPEQTGDTLTETNASAVAAFVDFVKAASYKGKSNSRIQRLHSLVFWTGAGFSKSWDERAPVGEQLFTLPENVLLDAWGLGAVRALLGTDEVYSTIPARALREVVYALDVQTRFPDVRGRFLDGPGIGRLRDILRRALSRRFEEIFPQPLLVENDESVWKFSVDEPTEAQGEIVGFFRQLLEQADGSSSFAEGLRTNFISTNYDFVIETILDNIVGPDDSHLLYTYRGITPAEIVGVPLEPQYHDNWLVQTLIKINGGFELVADRDGYIFDYTEARREKTPNIILPSREQVYSDPYFDEIFPKSVRLLREARALAIVGYSLPDDDALLRFILRQFAESGEDAVGKFVFYIDISERDAMRGRVEKLFPFLKPTGPLALHLYSGSFADFAVECRPLLP